MADVEITVRMPEEWMRFLLVLTNNPRPNDPVGMQVLDVAQVLVELADHAQQGVFRPGAWEREWLCQALGYEWIDRMEIDPDRPHFQRPKQE